MTVFQLSNIDSSHGSTSLRMSLRFLGELAVQILYKGVLRITVFQLSKIDSSHGSTSLRMSLRFDVKGQSGDNKPMVSSALGTTHGLGHLHILFYSLNDDIISEMPMLGA